MTDLLKDLEGAAEGSPELDLALWCAVSGAAWRWLDEDREIITCDRYGPGAAGNPIVSLDAFTRNAEAALQLIPDGWRARMDYSQTAAAVLIYEPWDMEEPSVIPTAQVLQAEPIKTAASILASAPSLALALSIAALRVHDIIARRAGRTRLS
jgi:hypothetical protein